VRVRAPDPVENSVSLAETGLLLFWFPGGVSARRSETEGTEDIEMSESPVLLMLPFAKIWQVPSSTLGRTFGKALHLSRAMG
jgi:hypothetical protein